MLTPIDEIPPPRASREKGFGAGFPKIRERGAVALVLPLKAEPGDWNGPGTVCASRHPDAAKSVSVRRRAVCFTMSPFGSTMGLNFESAIFQGR
jgi:hypothetical protein